MSNRKVGLGVVLFLSLVAAVFMPMVGQASKCSPGFGITSAPAYGEYELLHGTVTCVDPSLYRVAVFIYVDGWWIKPSETAPLTTIDGDGTWSADITTGGIDQQATRIAAFMVPADFKAPILLGEARLPTSVFDDAVAYELLTRPSQLRTIEFSGYQWWVKESAAAPVGPGPNYFSDREEDVWVDDRGRLHLTIRSDGEHWYATEVVATQSLGYGTYRFTVGEGVDRLDKNVVMGLFTWDTAGAQYNYREIDIEFSRWGEATDLNAQYVVQPWDTPGNRYRFPLVTGSETSTHGFEWSQEEIHFSSESMTGQELQSWRYRGPDIPPSGGESTRINLWLLDGLPPSDGKEAEAIIEAFEFVPEH